MEIFKYGHEEIEYLKRSDAILGAAIDRIGPIERSVTPDVFTGLVKSIVGQQISAAAAASVWQRVRDRFGAITPEILAEASPDDIQGCGLSMRKVTYIQGAAGAVVRGDLDLEELYELPDDEVINRLCSLKGIGPWTAEMILLFSMQRPDVVSWGDLAIRRGMMALYGLDTLDKTAFDAYRRRYSPFGSVASLYIWAVAGGA